jgi:hypothetical protein
MDSLQSMGACGLQRILVHDGLRLMLAPGSRMLGMEGSCCLHEKARRTRAASAGAHHSWRKGYPLVGIAAVDAELVWRLGSHGLLPSIIESALSACRPCGYTARSGAFRDDGADFERCL